MTLDEHIRREPKPVFLMFLLAIFLMPLSYAIKFMIGLEGLTWIDPTIICSVCVLIGIVLTRGAFPIPQINLLFISIFVFWLLYFISVLINSLEDGTVPMGEVFREPLKLIFGLIVAYLTSYYAREKENRRKMYKWIQVSAVVQFLIAVYFYFSAEFNLPLPASVHTYVVDYFERQVLWNNDTPIFRLGGTFIESPPFGLFMLVALFCSVLSFKEFKSKFSLFVIAITAIGVIGSLSDQVLIGFFISIWILLLGYKPQRVFLRVVKLGIITSFILLSIFLIIKTTPHMNEKMTSYKSGEVYGSSIGERMFHFKFALYELTDNTRNLFFGVGPGMYGMHANNTGLFPETVTPQFTFIEVFSEIGFIGGVSFLCIVLAILIQAKKLHGLMGTSFVVSVVIAAGFQASWKWTSVFFLLALMMSFSSQTRIKEDIVYPVYNQRAFIKRY